MSTEARLERISARTYRIRGGERRATTTASRFAMKEPGAAQDYPPSRFAGWTQPTGSAEAPEWARRPG